MNINLHYEVVPCASHVARRRKFPRERANFFGRDPNINRSQEIQSAIRHRGLLGRGSSRQQSAMEYLMTYGWAILIIAVVLGVLYYLGIFNGQNLTPRLQPGSCHVTHTTQGFETFGVCEGLPEFVAYMDNLSSGIAGPAATPMTIDFVNNAYTMCGWADVKNYTVSYPTILFSVHYASSGLVVQSLPGHVSASDFMSGQSNYIGSVPYGSWHFYCAVYTGHGSSLRDVYIDGALAGTDSLGGVGTYVGEFQIGDLGRTCCSLTQISPTYLANIQYYNASLSAAEVQALYMEGIGGAPIKLQNLVGWWPLNGDTNDYSGNNNNGQVTNSTQYINTWINSYSAP